MGLPSHVGSRFGISQAGESDDQQNQRDADKAYSPVAFLTDLAGFSARMLEFTKCILA